MKRVLLVAAIFLVILLTVLLVRTMGASSLQLAVEPAVQPLGPSLDAAVGRLAAAVSIATVSHESGRVADPGAFRSLHALLEESYPRLHQALEHETVAELSLLYRWPGIDASIAPALLLAHQDVVPVEPGSDGAWQYPPFAGTVAGGFVWGRGTLDDKASLMAILEAVEGLVGQGWAPRRTIYLGFGHDEEVFGRFGAAQIAARLHQRQVHLALVLDEGMVLKQDGLPGLPVPVALVGVAEKGLLTLALDVTQEGGHSSMPPAESAIGILSAAVARLERRQMPLHSGGVMDELLRHAGPEMGLPMRLVLANRWLFGRLVARKFAASPPGAAMMRTTTAPTILQAGVKENVLPRAARAVVNFRIHPADSVASVRAHVERVVDDPRVVITELPGSGEPSSVSSSTSASYRALARAVRAVFPEAIVAPSLVLAATDSRYFAEIASDIYRFAPLVLRDGDLPRVHGVDERIAVADYERAIRFYAQVVRNLGE